MSGDAGFVTTPVGFWVHLTFRLCSLVSQGRFACSGIAKSRRLRAICNLDRHWS